MKEVKGAVVLMMALLWLGCVMGPEYQQPDIHPPENWNDMTLEGSSSYLPITIGQVPEADWWRMFANDELNELIGQALDRNHDLRKAGLRVLEARAIAYGAGAGLYPNFSVDGGYSRTRRSETILVAPTSGAPQGSPRQGPISISGVPGLTCDGSWIYGAVSGVAKRPLPQKRSQAK